jgi:hypothetical protein
MDNYTSFRDMIDGGGAGASGSQFQGGGLLSLLANLFATPLGSEQMTRPQARPPIGLMDMPPVVPSTPPVAPTSDGDFIQTLEGFLNNPGPRERLLPPTMMESLQFGIPSVPNVTTTTLPPQGAVPNDELVRTLEAFLRNSGSPMYRTGR